MNVSKHFTVLVTVLLAFVANSFIYLSFTNIYNSKIMNLAALEQQFHNGIYQYRILGWHLLMGVYGFLSDLNLDYSILKLKFLEPNSEPQLFIAFYILNTIFAVVGAAILSYLLQSRWIKLSPQESLAIGGLAVTIMAISQFVILPYDNTSYFFILLFSGLLFRYLEKNDTPSLVGLVVLMVISTLNRESSALCIAMAGSLLYFRYGIKRESIVPLFALVAAFVVTYLGLRFFSKGGLTTNDGSLFWENLSLPKNWLGIGMSMTLFLVTLGITKMNVNKQLILVFHLFSFPYIAMCFYTGILYEIRLYIPLFLISVILSKIDIYKLNINR